jgi:uncharacterized peroxidase-related enzyme
MPRIQPIDPATATGDAATHLATSRKMFGGTPNMILTAAQAPAVVGAMLGFFASLGKASLGGKIGEQIAIAVAQANGCGYCLSAHTAIGKMHGLPGDELAAARRATSTQPKTAAILALALAINQSRGHVSDEVLRAARNAGITDAEIVEVVAHVALNVFTNTLNNVSETEVDFPLVPLEAAA